MGAGYVSATSEVVVVSADRALALPPTRPRRALRHKVLKTLQFKTICSTLACNIPAAAMWQPQLQLDQWPAARTTVEPEPELATSARPLPYGTSSVRTRVPWATFAGKGSILPVPLCEASYRQPGLGDKAVRHLSAAKKDRSRTARHAAAAGDTPSE